MSISENIATYAEASSLLSMGLTNKGLDARQAAMVNMGSRHRKTVPRTIIYPCVKSLSVSAVRYTYLGQPEVDGKC
jgi:hypothetical protein